MKRYVGTVLLICMSCLKCSAQDPQLSQSYAAPLFLNPAFTGDTYSGRVVLNYRNQWPKIPKGWVTYLAGWDQHLKRFNSGVGISVFSDVSGVNALRFTNIGGSYAYMARITRFAGFRAGLRVAYAKRTYDKSSLLFADQVIRDNAPVTIETGMVGDRSYMDIGTGFLAYARYWWLGTALWHINRPNESLFEDREARLPLKYSVHGGASITLERNRNGGVKSRVIVAFNYKAQLDWDQMDLGAYYANYPLAVGVWYRGLPGVKAYKPGYRNDDAVVFMAGYIIQQKFRFSYSYDITLSRLAGNTGGSHEIAIATEFPFHHKQRRKIFVVPCAKF